nr:PREDICTED: NEDD4-binding protein 1-like [Latimeria chalumnae]|eukprot:XP_014352418.1 PREDICTED: NEDD4-binding protein 1-like [Latimeria chalumnae]
MAAEFQGNPLEGEVWRSPGRGGDPGVLDEFAVSEEHQGSLMELRRRIEGLFGVEMKILGMLAGGAPQEESSQIWLQLQGAPAHLKRAKEFIKGLCTPELIQQVRYPKDMHCIFTGAKGLFLDSLIGGTSAYINVHGPGSVEILGLQEPVVMAKSRIQEFVSKYEKNQRVPEEDESTVKRCFKDLVEVYDDRHVIDLLILPTSVKEDLLNLIQEFSSPRPGQECLNPSGDLRPTTVLPDPLLPLPIDSKHGPVFCQSQGLQSPQSRTCGAQVLWKRASSPNLVAGHSKAHHNHPTPPLEYQHINGQEIKLPLMFTEDKEICVGHSPDPASPTDFCQNLIDFNTSAETPGPAGNLTNPVEKSSDYSINISSGTEKEFNMMLSFFTAMGFHESIIRKVLSEGGLQEPSQILDRVQMEQQIKEQDSATDTQWTNVGHAEACEEQTGDVSEDYILEVIKEAAKKCGYSVQEILDVYKTFGIRSHVLLKQLNEKRSQDDAVPEALATAWPTHVGPAEFVAEGPHEDHSKNGADIAAHGPTWAKQKKKFIQSPGLRGPPENTYSRKAATFPKSSPKTDYTNSAEALPQYWKNLEVSAKNEECCFNEPVLKQAFEIPPVERDFEIPPADGNEKEKVPTVTAKERFNEKVRTPFKLKLKNTQGKGNLRHVIIDGSNVAMTHGLGRFFSCRGIALAVQYFWDRGHREVTVFVPNWRLKKDTKTKEQHFLENLKKVGILSVTPSRFFEGRCIAAHDDRSCACLVFSRLLQYTFAGDIFMVPDDPLGKTGPHLDQFLTKTPREHPVPCHSFAGRGAPAHPPHPTSQTGILNFRDRKPRGFAASQGESKPTGPRKPQETEEMRRNLLEVFSDSKKVDQVLKKNGSIRNLNKLSEMILSLDS